MSTLLAASTLGAPEASLDATIDELRARGVRGIEVRPGDLTSLPGRRGSLRDGGFEFVALATRIRLGATPESCAAEVFIEAVDDCQRIGATHMRVFPGAVDASLPPTEVPQVERGRQLALARNLASLSRIAGAAGVTVCLETHDSHPRGRDVAEALAAAREAGADELHLGAVWDVLHPWRVGESVTETLTALEDWLVGGRGWIQLKDVAAPDDTTPVLPGSGSVPWAEAAVAAVEAGYAGPFSLEWERAWFPAIPPLGAALDQLVDVAPTALGLRS